MDIKNLSTLHAKSMSRLRKLLKKQIRIIYSDNTSYIVPCTISDNSLEMLKYNEYTGKDYKVFNILIDDLKGVNAPVIDFMYVEYDRVRYQVHAKLINGVYENTISLISNIYRGDING